MRKVYYTCFDSKPEIILYDEPTADRHSLRKISEFSSIGQKKKIIRNDILSSLHAGLRQIYHCQLMILRQRDLCGRYIR
jgi:hypothetical protein